jgi:hypothetical protein
MMKTPMASGYLSYLVTWSTAAAKKPASNLTAIFNKASKRTLYARNKQ